MARKLRIREDIAATVDLILLDPMREKIRYGKWSDLVEALLRNWIAEQRSGGQRRTLGPDEIKKLETAHAILVKTPFDNQQIVAAAWNEAQRLLKEVLG